MSLMEVFYCVWKDKNAQEGKLACQQCLVLPITWVHEDKALLEKAAEIKATHPLSLVDTWIGAAAMLQDAVLIHKEPEFATLDCRQLVLPYK